MKTAVSRVKDFHLPTLDFSGYLQGSNDVMIKSFSFQEHNYLWFHFFKTDRQCCCFLVRTADIWSLVVFCQAWTMASF